jgi:hypothetical protein
MLTFIVMMFFACVLKLGDGTRLDAPSIGTAERFAAELTVNSDKIHNQQNSSDQDHIKHTTEGRKLVTIIITAKTNDMLVELPSFAVGPTDRWLVMFVLRGITPVS